MPVPRFPRVRNTFAEWSLDISTPDCYPRDVADDRFTREHLLWSLPLIAAGAETL